MGNQVHTQNRISGGVKKIFTENSAVKSMANWIRVYLLFDIFKIQFWSFWPRRQRAQKKERKKTNENSEKL